MPESIPVGARVAFSAGGRMIGGTVVGRSPRWLIVNTSTGHAPKLVAPSACEVVADVR